MREAGLLQVQQFVPPGVALKRPVRVTNMEYAPDGKWLLLGLGGEKPFRYQVQAWDLRRGAPDRGRWYPAYTEHLEQLLFAPKGTRLLTVGEDKNEHRTDALDPDGVSVVRLWDWEEGKLELRQDVRLELRSTQRQIDNTAMSPDGRLLALHRPLAGIELWDVGAKVPHRTAWIKNDSSEYDCFGAVAFLADGKGLVTAGEEGQGAPAGSFRGLLLRFWDISGTTPVERKSIRVPGWSAGFLEVSPDGRLLAVGDHGKLIVWKVETGEQIWSHELPGSCRFRFAPDSRHLITCNKNGTLYVFRLVPPPTRSP